VTGNLTHVETILPKLAAAYRDIYIEQYKAEAGGELCWKQSDGADAMEVRAQQHPHCTVHREESRGRPGLLGRCVRVCACVCVRARRSHEDELVLSSFSLFLSGD